MEIDYRNRIELLRGARLELLRLHKKLVDFEREVYEGENGQISGGTFLQLLLNDKRFNWLRVFSQLIVEIDESFDLDDGIDREMTENYLNQIQKLVHFEGGDDEFRAKYKNALQSDVEVLSKHTEIKKMLSDKKGT
jgi:hypothetical protein